MLVAMYSTERALLTRWQTKSWSVLMAAALLAAPLADAKPRAPRTTRPAAATPSPAADPEPAPALPAPSEAIRQARALRDDGKTEVAAILLAAVLDVNPADIALRFEYAETLMDLSLDENALPHLEKCVEQAPDDEGWRARLADLHLALDRPEGALGHYSILSARRPNDPAIRRKLADILVAMDRSREAIPHLEAYSAAVPGDIDALEILRKLYAWSERPREALAVLQRLADLKPDDLDIARDLAAQYVDLGDEKRAIGLYERVVAGRPADADSQRALGELYEWNDAPRKALTRYDAYLALRPHDGNVRARALQLSVNLGLGRAAREHGTFLSDADPWSQRVAREAMLADTGFGTSVSIDYAWFSDNQGFHRHEAGPRVMWAATDWLSVGARYAFLHLRGPDSTTGRKATLLGHAAALLARFSLPSAFSLEASAGVNRYDTGFTSGNARLVLGRTFGPVTLELSGERQDVLSGVDDVKAEVVSNSAALAAGWEIWGPVRLATRLAYGRYDDGNNRMSGELGLSVLALEMPRIEVAYVYGVEAFSDLSPRLTYWSPAHYQIHGPSVALRHPVTRWFLYGVHLRLSHAIEDASFLATYGAELVFRPAVSHVIRLSYQRTDTLAGTASSRYQENRLTAGYAFEF